MFLKISNWHWPKQWSITSKLTFIYALVTSLIVVTIVFAEYWAMQNAITVAEKQFIADEVQIIRNFLTQSPNNPAVLLQEINAVPASVKSAEYRYYVRIYNDKNETVLQTTDMSTAVPDAQFPALNLTNWQKHAFQWHSSNGRDYLSMTAPILYKQINEPNLYMNMIFDGTYPEAMVREYRNKAFAVLGLVILFVVWLGRFITQKGLSRLYEMAHLTESISPDRLMHRLNINEWPNELVPLVVSYNNMLKRIEQAFQRLSDCSAELAHELRTPINNLMLTTEITLTSCRKPAEYKVVLESNYEEYRRLARIIDNVLFLAKTDNLSCGLKKVPINLNHELSKIIEFYKIMASEKAIQITLDGEGVIETELILFQRLISNLLVNAIKYTNSNGIIAVSIKKEAGKYLVLTVKDTGSGIHQDQLKNIFDRFYRVKSSQSYYVGGAGLGLAIVKSIMTLHGGEVKIESEVGKGTEISLWFFKSCHSAL